MKHKILLLLAAMLLSWFSLAQDNQDQSTTNDTQQSATNAEPGQSTVEETAEDAELAGGDEEEEVPGRFIPSEQISQDLGVSFPIDI